uniref:Uncharacterized protein n=1 Tax=Geoglobus ahangari TaxID=113653 RepID=A0A7C3YN93_9EURY
MRVYHIALPHDISAWIRYLPRVISILSPRIIFLETGIPIPEYTIKQLESLFESVSKGLPPEYLIRYVKEKRLPGGEYFSIVSRCLYLSGKSVILERVPKECQEYTSRGIDYWNRAIRMFFRKKFKEAAENVRNCLREILESTAIRDKSISGFIKDLNEDVTLLLGAAHSPEIRGISKWYPKEFEIDLEYLQEQKKLIKKDDMELALKMILVDIASLKIPFRVAWKKICSISSEDLMNFCEFVSKNEHRASQAALEWLSRI